MYELAKAHVVCPFCLREFDDVVQTDLGASNNEGIMLCPHCYGVSLLYKSPLGMIHLRKPDPREQRTLDNDPLVQRIVAQAWLHGPPSNE